MLTYARKSPRLLIVLTLAARVLIVTSGILAAGVGLVLVVCDEDVLAAEGHALLTRRSLVLGLSEQVS